MSEWISAHASGGAPARAALERTILDGGVALFPADGLYGLACDPMRAAAIERIHSIKGRDDGKPAAVLYLSPLIMRELLASLGQRSREAVAELLPGPLTLVLANPESRYPLACREDPARLGVRLIEGPLSGASVVLLQTSANRSGEPAPSSPDDVEPHILEAVDLAIDGGELSGKPSTVVDLTDIESGGAGRILREGAMPAEELTRRLEGLAAG